MRAPGWIELADGSRAYQAWPDEAGPVPAIVVIGEAYGLNPHIQRVVSRFAAAGFAALAPDLFDQAIYDYADLRGAIGHLQRLDDATAIARTSRAVDQLAQDPAVTAIGAVGFCMGGRLAVLAGLEDPRLAAITAFYGGGIAPAERFFGKAPLVDRLGELRAPLQLWYGADDAFIRPDEHGRIAVALGSAGKRYSLGVFPGATHGFFGEDRPSYAAEPARIAWRDTLAFQRDYLAASRATAWSR
ncbi:MAG: dienelactone hydrolase family protein [Deltaproteobacteria bacterium]|nr:dienelactone hydrolase family protein [Deltaproteobacteria bacterium]